MVSSTKYIGVGVKRREDKRLLAGKGTFVDDIWIPGMTYLKFVHSVYSHAIVKSIDASKAERLKGVVAVVTPRDVVKMMNPLTHPLLPKSKYYVLATDRVRYVGQPVAAVVAETRSVAEDAADLIDVEYEPLQPVVDPEKAMEDGAPQLDEVANNTAWQRTFHFGDIESVFSKADTVVSERLYFPRYSSTPLEPWALIANYDVFRNYLTVYSPEHGPIGRNFLTFQRALGLPGHSIRLVSPDIGGSFGNKIMIYPYLLLASAISKHVARPVKWVAYRNEELKMSMHSPERVAYADIAAARDGRILGLRAKIIDNFGAYMLTPEPLSLLRFYAAFVGPYKIANVYIDAYGVLTNKCPTGPNRGYGCQQTFFVLERMVDLMARKLGKDRAEIRFQNFVQPRDHPYTTPFGCVYDSGDYPRVLKRALELINYEATRSECEKLRRQGRYVGIGIAATVDPSAANLSHQRLLKSSAMDSGTGEAVTLKVEPTGSVMVFLGTVPQGQAHETTAAQVVAEELGIPLEAVYVMPGFDSNVHPYTGSSGTYADRFATAAVPAIITACRKLKEKIIRAAAQLLDAKPEDFEYREGEVVLTHAPEKRFTLTQIANSVFFRPGELGLAVEEGLEATCVYTLPIPEPALPDDKGRLNICATYGSAVNIAVVEVDSETGHLKILKYVAVHDAGRIINPMIVEGQMHGGVMHGVGGAIYGEYVYDEQGQLLTSTFADYLIPTSLEAPTVETDHIETNSPLTILGSKGMGESGAMSAPACLASAVEDALSPLNITVSDLPLKPDYVWTKIRNK